MEFSIEPVGVEFSFDFLGKGSEKTQFYRELYGYTSYSNYGKYKYEKKGILSDMKYLKPAHSTIIVSRQNAKSLRHFFKKFKNELKLDERIVLLKASEAKKLGFKAYKGWSKVYEEIKGNENLILKADL